MKRAVVVIALAAIAAGSFQSFYLTIWRRNWEQLSAQLTELPYRQVPGLRQLCVEADRRVPVGARVLFVAPRNGGYEYAFRRAQYLLAGKDVVPHGDASYIVCLPACRMPGYTMVWRNEQGALLKR